MTAVVLTGRPADEVSDRPGNVWDPVTVKWAVALTVAVMASGMAFSLGWNPLVHHLPGQLLPGDFGSTMKDALVISQGRLSWVYSDHAQLVTLPGYPLLLAPVAGLCRLLHLSQPWLVSGPFEMATGAVALLGVDRLAVTLDIPRRSRMWLSAAEAAAVWPTLVVWGHPEDVLAVGLCALCLSAAAEGRWRPAGWLLGAALAVQLLAVLLLPVLVAAAGRRRAVRMTARAAVLPGLLSAAVLVPDFHAAWSALTGQPNYPGVDHPTPWIVLSPSMGHGTVAAGPGRIVGLLAALGCGVMAGRAVGDPARLVWWASVALAGRCLFEAVMDPYYVMPALALALPLAFRQHRRRVAVVALATLALMVDTAESAGMWTYWLRMAALLAVVLATTHPGGTRVAPRRSAVGTGLGRAGGRSVV